MWMTSAAELFHNRRYRFGLRHNAVDVSGTDSTQPDSSASSSHQHRTANRRHNHPYNSQNNRREHRHDLDGCYPASRWDHNHRRRLDHLELDAEQTRSQSSSDGITNSNDFRSIHRRRATGSERLPGSVLLARERLVERLRGVSVSGNRQTSGSSSNARQDDFSSSDNSNFTGSHGTLLETRGEWVEELASESWQALMPTTLSQETRRKHPPGLTQDSLNCLQIEIYRNDEKTDETSSAARECTICLEGFQEGDKLIRLHCAHKFHSSCLLPWVQVRGACPNCRKTILVNVPLKR